MRLVERFNTIPTRTIIIFLVLAGIVERSMFLLLRPFPGAAGEAFDVAQALANGAGFSDAYFPNQGPTAHLLPITPAIAGAIYAIFGVRSWPAEFLLICWSIGLTLGTYILLFRAFGRLGTPVWARLCALVVACIFPAYIVEETVDFRIWEGGLAVFLCALFLDRLLALSTAEALTTPTIVAMAFLNALLFFVNPPLGIGAYACAMLFCFKRLSFVQLAGAAAIATIALAVFVAPWTIRNKIVLGEPIVLRSNAGLELALANYPGALNATDRNDEFIRRIREIHPRQSHEARQNMRRLGGEAEYARQLGEDARRWITSNPGATALLALRHLRQIFAPEPWQFQGFRSGTLATPRAALASLVGIIGLIGLALACRRPGWVFPAFLILTPTLVLCLFQPIPRYTYLFYPMLLFCAADGLASIRTKWLRR